MHVPWNSSVFSGPIVHKGAASADIIPLIPTFTSRRGTSLTLKLKLVMFMSEGEHHCAVRLRGFGIIISEAGRSSRPKGKPTDVLENGAGSLNSSAQIKWRASGESPGRFLRVLPCFL